MYFKCNNFLLASFPISLKFVRLIPEKVLDILRDKSSYWYGYRKSCFNTKICYISSILMQICYIFSKKLKISIFCTSNFYLIWAILSKRAITFISLLGDWSQPVYGIAMTVFHISFGTANLTHEE